MLSRRQRATLKLNSRGGVIRLWKGVRLLYRTNWGLFMQHVFDVVSRFIFAFKRELSLISDKVARGYWGRLLHLLFTESFMLRACRNISWTSLSLPLGGLSLFWHVKLKAARYWNFAGGWLARAQLHCLTVAVGGGLFAPKLGGGSVFVCIDGLLPLESRILGGGH